MRSIFYGIFGIPNMFLLPLFLLPLLLMAKEPGSNKRILTDSSPVKLTLTYYQSISCPQECRKYTIEGCSKITGQPNKLICREQVELIRPRSLVEFWRKEQYKQRYIDFTIAEFGIQHAKAHMNHVTPFIPGLFKEDSDNTNTQLVTGVFKRHSVDSKLYIFQNLRTGKLSSIHVTPKHPFYSKSRQGFLPLKNVTAKDILMTGNSDNVKLVYSGRNIRTTGDNSAGIPRLVYNMEVKKKHIYFVGRDKIMVHNTCLCGICNQSFDASADLRQHFRDVHGAVMEYICGVSWCTQKYTQIRRINKHQQEAHGITNTNSCEFCGKQLDNAEEVKQHIDINHTEDNVKKLYSDIEKDSEATVNRLPPVFVEKDVLAGVSSFVSDFSKERPGGASEKIDVWTKAADQIFFDKVVEWIHMPITSLKKEEAHLAGSTINPIFPDRRMAHGSAIMTRMRHASQ